MRELQDLARRSGIDLGNLSLGNFTVPRYTPAPEIQAYHDALTLRQTNEIVLPVGPDEEWGEYWLPLLTVPIVLISVLALWCITFCCTPCMACNSRKDPGARRLGFCGFLVLIIPAIALFANVLVSPDKLDQVSERIEGAIVELDVVLDGWATVLERVGGSISGFQADVDAVRAQCPTQVSNEVEQAAELDELSSVRSEAVTSSEKIQAVQRRMAETLTGWDEVVSEVEFVFFLQAIFLLVVSLFVLGATILVHLCGRDMSSTCVRGSACASCISLFTFGLMLVTVGILFGATFRAFTVIGSDVCAPSPDQTIQNLLAQANGTVPLNADPTSDWPLCTPMVANASMADVAEETLLLCFYQTCQGSPLVQTMLSLAGRVIQGLLDAVEAVEDAAANNLPPDCGEALNALSDNVSGEGMDMIAAVLSNFGCERVNGIYQRAVHVAICDTLLEALSDAWRLLVSGSFLLLSAMLLYLFFHLDLPHDHQFAPSFSRGQTSAAGIDDGGSKNSGGGEAESHHTFHNGASTGPGPGSGSGTATGTGTSRHGGGGGGDDAVPTAQAVPSFALGLGEVATAAEGGKLDDGRAAAGTIEMAPMTPPTPATPPMTPPLTPPMTPPGAGRTDPRKNGQLTML